MSSEKAQILFEYKEDREAKRWRVEQSRKEWAQLRPRIWTITGILTALAGLFVWFIGAGFTDILRVLIAPISILSLELILFSERGSTYKFSLTSKGLKTSYSPLTIEWGKIPEITWCDIDSLDECFAVTFDYPVRRMVFVVAKETISPSELMKQISDAGWVANSSQ